MKNALLIHFNLEIVVLMFKAKIGLFKSKSMVAIKIFNFKLSVQAYALIQWKI